MPRLSSGVLMNMPGVTGVQLMWVGWPGVSVPDKDQTIVIDKLKEERCIPIFLDEELVDQYYSGYCNNILWPLFHYMWLPQDYKFKKAKDFESQLEAYEKANQMFSDAVCRIYKEEGDIVWCHDYHLMILPMLLKKFKNNMKVGWFLHTPFPSSELYRALPNRRDLLKAVLESDLIGFHTYDYASTPIHHLDQSLDFHTLCALYAVTDVALVTSLRDGMNLVSYEYVACQESNKGVLILSEFAGAAQSLGAGAIIVNPWNVAEVAKSIKDALNMPADKREEQHRHNYELVSAHSAQDWAEDYVCDLHNTGTATKALLQTKQPIVVLPIKETASRYRQSRSRLLILGFNETLTEQVQSLERGATDQTENMKLKLNPELKGPLKTLCDNENTTVIVVSGYGKEVLDENFEEFKMWLAAENGMFLRQTGEQWIVTTTEHLEIGCSDSVKKVIEYFTRRTPKSYQEQCETSFVWNYKYADDDFGRNQAKDMLQHLGAYSSSNRSADVVEGRRSIEVCPVGVTKGNAVIEIIEELGRKKNITTPIDYVLCIGHFLAKDEDVYTLPYFDIQPESKRKAKGQTDCTSIKFDLKAENYFSCTVGRERSLAKYKLEGTSDVVSLLRDLAQMLSLPLDTVEHDGSQL